MSTRSEESIPPHALTFNNNVAIPDCPQSTDTLEHRLQAATRGRRAFELLFESLTQASGQPATSPYAPLSPTWFRYTHATPVPALGADPQPDSPTPTLRRAKLGACATHTRALPLTLPAGSLLVSVNGVAVWGMPYRYR